MSTAWFPASSSGSSVASPPGTFVPPGALTAWNAAKQAARAGTGVASATVWGASIVAGQSAAPVTDVLTYGWVGRLDSILSGQLGGAIEGYTIAGLNPPTLTSPSSPYSTPGQHTSNDGPFGQCWSTSTVGSTWLTITIPVHPVTGATPTSVDLFTVDFNTTASGWTWTVTGGAGGTGNVTGTPAVNNSVGNGALRRTTVALSGATSYSIAIQQNQANSLIFCGHAVTYASSGFALMRAPVPGFRGVDYATGGGTALGSSALNSVTPDHLKPWTGVADSWNNAGTGFPFNSKLHILGDIPGNDTNYGASIEKVRKAMVRFISAARRANPATPGSVGASIVLMADPSFDPYSDNYSAIGNTQSGASYETARYKDVLYSLASQYGCVYIDLGQVFGETPAARGLVVAGGVHPTQNGAGTGGGDGHLLIAQTLAGGTYAGTSIQGIL